jgi:hypothetical protein
MNLEQSKDSRLGIVVSGSVTRGVEVKLDSSSLVEGMAVGRYVTTPWWRGWQWGAMSLFRGRGNASSA